MRPKKRGDAKDGRKGEVWVLKVRGELVGVYDTRVGVVKAVVRKKERMEEMDVKEEVMTELKMEVGQKSKVAAEKEPEVKHEDQVVAYVVVNDGLHVEAVKSDDTKELTITAAKWDLMW